MAHLTPMGDFEVASITRTQIDDQEWYEYVITNNHTTIKGQRQGTLKQVNQHALEYSEQLNERAKGNYRYNRAKQNNQTIKKT